MEFKSSTALRKRTFVFRDIHSYCKLHKVEEMRSRILPKSRNFFNMTIMNTEFLEYVFSYDTLTYDDII